MKEAAFLFLVGTKKDICVSLIIVCKITEVINSSVSALNCFDVIYWSWETVTGAIQEMTLGRVYKPSSNLEKKLLQTTKCT